jgi:hypothetical protein
MSESKINYRFSSKSSGIHFEFAKKAFQETRDVFFAPGPSISLGSTVHPGQSTIAGTIW